MWMLLCWLPWAALAEEPAVPAPVAHVAAADFSGTWTLDKGASGDLTPLLKAQGIGALQRSMIRKMSVTQVIVDEGKTLNLHVETSVMTDDRVFVADGVAREETSPQGATSLVSHTRSDDGTWVTTSKRDGLTVTSRRTLEGATMVLTMAWTDSSGPHEVRRVFRRVR